MLVIRLQRRGRKGLAVYRVVVQDSRVSPSGERVIARLGNYNPHTKEASIDKEVSQKFLDNGAQPSPRVIMLLKQAGVKMPVWVKDNAKKKGAIKNAEKLRKNQEKEVEAPSEDSPATEQPEEVVVAEDAKPQAEPAKEA